MTAPTQTREWLDRAGPDGPLDAPVEPRLVQANLGELLRNGVPRPLFVDRHGLIPEASRVWAVGPAGSGKSIWAANEASDLTREGLEVAVFSEENPLAEEVRRYGRFQPDLDRLHLYHGQGIDLADATCVAEMLRETAKCSVVIFDTLSACWSGDENDNAAIGELDREAFVAFTRQGAAVVVLDHSGHPVAFVNRKGVHAARGASAKGQKADVVLEFVTQAPGVFRIEPGKMRVGGHCPPPVTCTVIDTDDDGLEVIFAENAADLRTTECADVIVRTVHAAGMSMTSTEVRAALKSAGYGTGTTSEAMRLLREEPEPRVRVARGKARTGQTALLWGSM
jgi:hypothetical protein